MNLPNGYFPQTLEGPIFWATPLVILASFITAKVLMSKKVPKVRLDKLHSGIFVLLMIPIIGILYMNFKHVKKIEKNLDRLNQQIGSSFPESSFYSMGLQDFSGYMNLLKEKMVSVEELRSNKLQLDRKLLKKLFPSLNKDLSSSTSLSQKTKRKIFIEIQTATEIHSYLKGLSDDLSRLVKDKTSDYSRKIDSIVEASKFTFVSYKQLIEQILAKLELIKNIQGCLGFVGSCLIMMSIAYCFFGKKSSTDFFAKERTISKFIFCFAIFSLLVGFFSLMIFMGLQRRVASSESTHFGTAPHFASVPTEHKLVMTSLEDLKKTDLFKDSFTYIYDTLKEIKNSPNLKHEKSHLKELKLNIKEVAALLKDYSGILINFTSYLSDINVLIKQINLKVSISNFNFPGDQSIENLGHEISHVLKDKSKTLMFSSIVLLGVALSYVLKF